MADKSRVHQQQEAQFVHVDERGRRVQILYEEWPELVARREVGEIIRILPTGEQQTIVRWSDDAENQADARSPLAAPDRVEQQGRNRRQSAAQSRARAQASGSGGGGGTAA